MNANGDQASERGLAVTCSFCSAEYQLEEGVIETRATKEYGIFQEGIICSHCHEFAHVQLVSRGLERQRTILDRAKVLYKTNPGSKTLHLLEKAKRKHQAYYDALQKRRKEVCFQ